MFNKILRNIGLCALFATPLVMAFVATFQYSNDGFLGLFFPFISGKNFLFRILVEVATASWLILAFRDKSYRPKTTFLFWAVIAFTVITLIADVTSVNPYKSLWSNFERMEGFVGIFHLALYFIVLQSMLVGEVVWSKFLYTSVGVALFSSIFAIVQLLGEFNINQGGIRVDATFGNAIYLAQYMLFHAFLVAYLWGRRVEDSIKHLFMGLAVGLFLFTFSYMAHTFGPATAKPLGLSFAVLSFLLGSASIVAMFSVKDRVGVRTRLSTILHGSLIILFVSILITTGTRGAMLGVFAGVVVFGIMSWLRADSKRERLFGIGAVVVCVIAVGSFLTLRSVVNKNPQAFEGSPILQRIAKTSVKSDDTSARFMIWNMALKGFSDKPILGWGQESFNYVFSKYYDPKMFQREQWFDRAHNVYLDWLIAGGLFGLIAYLSLYGGALYLIFRPKSGFSYLEKSILAGLVASYAVHNIFVFDNLGSYITFYMFIAYIAVRSNTGKIVGEKINIADGVVIRVYTPAVILLLIWSIYFINVRPIFAGTMLIGALNGHPEGLTKNVELFEKSLSLNTFATTEIREQLTQLAMKIPSEQGVDQKFVEQFYTLARSEMQKQLEQTPEDVRYQLFMVLLLNRFGQSSEALSHAEKASVLSPNKQSTLFELASTYINLGQMDKALETIKRAYELDTSFVEPRVIYLITAIYAGRKDVEETLFQELNKTGNANDNRIVEAYVRTKQYQKAITIFESALISSPNNIDYKLKLAELYITVGASAKAIKVLESALSIDPSRADEINGYIKGIKDGSIKGSI